jgi:beta-N-acetylhexosaminidase
MAGHATYPAVDGERIASQSAPVIEGLLREELGFDGVIISDALDMKAVADTYGMGEAAVLAIGAGVDLLCLGNQTSAEDLYEVRDALGAAVAAGRLSEKRLVEAAGRVAALAEWARDPVPGPADPALGLAAARRAIAVTGEPLLSGPPVVVEIRAAGSMAVGDTAWGVAPVLAAAEPATVALAVTAEAAPGLLDGYGDRPVVIAYRDAHLHDWQRASLAVLRAERPDAVLVAMGGQDDLPGQGDDATVLRTLGSARVNAVAAVEILLGRELTA